MYKTLEDLWYGNIAPSEHFGSHDAEANHLITLAERNRERLCTGLTPEQAELLQKYIDSSDAYSLRMQLLAFCDGFSLAGKLMAEVLSDG